MTKTGAPNGWRSDKKKLAVAGRIFRAARTRRLAKCCCLLFLLCSTRKHLIYGRREEENIFVKHHAEALAALISSAVEVDEESAENGNVNV